MRTMQDKFAAEAEQIARAVGLEAVSTGTSAADGRGYWHFQDGHDTRLRVRYRFGPASAELTIDGPAFDYATETAPGLIGVTAERRADGSGWYYGLIAGYGDGAVTGAFFTLVGALLAPWRTADSFLKELGQFRAGLLDDQETAAATEIGQAMSLLAAAPPARLAAAAAINKALALLPDGTARGKRLAILADALSTAPAALTAAA